MLAKPNLIKNLLLFFFITFAVRVLSQHTTPEIYLEHVTIPGSIRSSFAVDILQDTEGLLWFATSSGLFQYDGYSFTPFPYAAPDSISLINKGINAVHWDREKNRLLVGTNYHGLLMYQYTDNTLRRILSTPKMMVNDIVQTDDGRIWTMTLTGVGKGGVFEFVNDSLVRIPAFADIKHPTSILAHNNSVIVGDVQKIIILKDGRIERTLPMTWSATQFSATIRATALMVDDKEQLWAGTEKDGILVYDLQKGEVVQYIPPDRRPFFSRINSMMQDDTGLIWILTRAEGLAIYNPVTEEVTQLNQDLSSQRSLSGNNCSGIFQDQTGVIWIGTNGDLSKYDRGKRKFDHFHYDAAVPSSLSDNMVRSAFVDKEGLIWCGTDGGTINILDRKTNRFQHIKVALPGSQKTIVPFAFEQKNDTEMFVGTSLGMLVLDKQKQKFQFYKPLQQITEGKRIRQLVRAGDMFYCLMGNVVVQHNIRTGESKIFNSPQDLAKIGAASYLFVDRHQQLWVGSFSGISRFLPRSQTFEHHKLVNDTARFMVLAINEFDNKLWIGTQNAGVFVMEETSRGFHVTKRIGEKEGLPDNTVYALLPDANAKIWLTSNHGLIKFNPLDTTFVRFEVSEGVQDEEFNRLAFTKTQRGELVFGGINGLNVFDPSKIKIDLVNVVPKIFGLTAYTTSSASSLQVKYVLLGRKEIKLAHNQNFFTINFGTTDFRTPVRYHYYYKLDGVDKHWINADQYVMAQYTNVDPGDYVFRLRVVDENKIMNEVTMKISIIPPFWKTWWFNVLAFVAAGVIVVGVIQGRVQQDKLDKHRLETLLKMRTKEIERSREELKSLNQKKDLIFSILSHDLRSPLTTLKGFLGLLIENGDVMPREEVKKYAITIRNSVTNSLDLIDNTLFWSLSQMGNITYNPSRLLLNEILDKVVGLYQLTTEKKQIKLTVEMEDAVVVFADDNMVYVTLRNLVSNALKYTPEGKSVTVKCKRLEKHVQITIQDEGIGMSPEYLSKVLMMDQPTLKKGTMNEKGTGLGLLLCKNFIEMNKGSLDVTSVENQGSVFVVTLPLSE